MSSEATNPSKSSLTSVANTDTTTEQQLDPIEGLRQLEKLISEAKEFDSEEKIAFNGNKMLNDLLDRPIDANASNDDNDNEDDAEDEAEESDVEEDIDNDLDSDHNTPERNGLKRGNDEDDQEVDDEKSEDISVSNKKKKKKVKSPKKKKTKKKSTNPTLRKNIKTIFTENDLDLETRLARKEEEERIARQLERSHQRQQELLSMKMDCMAAGPNDPLSQRFGEIPDEVLLSSDDEEDKQKKESSFANFLNNSFNNAFNNSFHNSLNELHSGSAEVIDLCGSDDESVPNTGALRNDYSMPGITLDYNMTGAYDDDVAIIDTSKDNAKTDGYEDVNNCGTHTDDALNAPDAEGRVLVNVAHPPEDQDIYLPPQIARAVKPHQIGGIRFLYDNVVESVERYKKSAGFGCILSHSMGLGKTMQIIAFIDVLLNHTDAKSVLCIVPINTLQNWISEFNMWTPEKASIESFFKKSETNDEIKYRTFRVFAINEVKAMTSRAKEILLWRKFGGVLLLGYEMYRILTSENKIKTKKDEDIDPKVYNQINSELKAALIDPGPDLVVCDEGHRIKNCNAATSQALKNIKTKRRIVLTGYPLQNKLLEYWCMVDFVRPNYLGLKNEFTNMFERPITNGQCIDSTPHDRKIMKYRAHVLYQLLKGFVQRRSHVVLKKALPPKHEYVLMCRMTAIQKDLMLAFLEIAINDPDAIGTVKGRISTLTLFAVCCKIWNHPDIIYDIIREGVVSDDLDLDFPTKKSLPKNNRKKKVNKELNSNTDPLNDLTLNPLNPLTDLANGLFSTPLRQKNDGVIDYSWAEDKLRDYAPGLIENSYKMVLLFEIIAETMAFGDRLLVFSQSLLTLDLIERFLQSREVPNTSTKWQKNHSYYRLDGSTSAQEREKFINLFNKTNNAHLFLISTRAGSLGINLIGANRIVIFDASWNPCHDAQAACRIYRYGQVKPCFIYRLVCDNSLEKKIYDRQVNKQGMANRVVDEQNVEANFTWREIHSLLDDLHDIVEPPVQVFSEQELSNFDDELIKRMCVRLNYSITRKPFEHESLLLDRKEQKLSTMEKRIAFGNYNEAKRLKGQQFDYNSYNSLRSPMNARNFPNPFNTGFQMPYNLPTPLLPSQITPNPYNFYNGMSSYPDVSQPLPPYPPQPREHSSTFMNFDSIAETLVQNGNSVKKLRIPSDLNIRIGPNNTVNIKKGDEVMVIRTQKGLYLRTNDGNIISIKNTNNVFPSESLPPLLPTPNNDSFGIIQQNLQCGGTVHCLTPSQGHSRASSTVSHPPEVVQLSDDEDNDDINNLRPTLDATQTLNSYSETSAVNDSNPSAMATESMENIDLDFDANSMEANGDNGLNDYTTRPAELSFESLLEPSLANSSAFDSVLDSTSYSINSNNTSSQLNGSSMNLEALEI